MTIQREYMTRTLEQLTQYSYCNFFDFKVFFKVENLGRYHWGQGPCFDKIRDNKQESI